MAAQQSGSSRTSVGESPGSSGGPESCRGGAAWALALVLAVGAAGSQALADGWQLTGQLDDTRYRHTATLLPSGKVLVAGGDNQDTRLAGAELYDPATGGWTPTGSLAGARYRHTATLLPSGLVLVAGGRGPGVVGLDSAELYDPATGLWCSLASGCPEGWNLDVAPPASLGSGRSHHTATLLPSGRVLVAGGESSAGSLDSVEVYDPATGLWCSSASECPEGWNPDVAQPAALLEARHAYTATLLPSGKLLIVGGRVENGFVETAELYDPAAGPTAAGELEQARFLHTATLLPSGDVLVVGGAGSTEILGSAELYRDGSWEPLPGLGQARARHSATLLPSGRVLVAGGCKYPPPPELQNCVSSLSSAELFDPTDDPANGTWGSAEGLSEARQSHTATLLPSGQVLVVAGYGGISTNLWWVNASVEVYLPSLGSWSAADPLSEVRGFHTATLLSSGEVLVRGHWGADVYNYDSGSDGWRWQAVNPDPANIRKNHTATLLRSGKVLVVGGSGQWHTYIHWPLDSVEAYDPEGDGGNGVWIPAASLAEARYWHTATLLPSGQVLVAGGCKCPPGNGPPCVLTFNRGLPLSSVEVYDPATGLWCSSEDDGCPAGRNGEIAQPSSLIEARGKHSATLLPSGRVLLAGGEDEVGAAMHGAEIYDPATGDWTAASPLAEPRARHTATLLPSGRVLVAGGKADYGTLSGAEVYDPATGSWTAACPLNVARQDHTATLLPSGRVLVAGGHSGLASHVSVEVYDPATACWTVVNSLVGPRAAHTATPLPSGKVLVTAGYGPEWTDPLLTNEVLDPGFDEARRPVVTAWPETIGYAPIDPSVVAAPFPIAGTGFGGDSEASGGGTRSSAVNFPLVQLRALDGGIQAWLPQGPMPVFCLDPTAGFCGDQAAELTIRDLPPIFHPGPHLLTVFTAGVPSESKRVDFECSLEVGSAVQTDPVDEEGEPLPVPINDTATLSVETLGGRLFQWQKCLGNEDDCAGGIPGGSEWVDVLGATETSYTTPQIDGPESGTRYRVVVDGGCMREASEAAVLAVEDSEPPSAAVVSPSGGEYWLLADPEPEIVTWSMSDDIRVCVVRASLWYSNDGGTNYVEAEELLHEESFDDDGVCVDAVETTSLEYMVPAQPPSGTAGSLYKIQVEVTDHANNGTVARSPSPFYIVQPDDDSIETLILWHSQRMAERFGDLGDLDAQLLDLANHPQVQGRVVDLAGVGFLAPLYEAWDAAILGDDPAADAALPNAVLFAEDGIQHYLLETLLPAYTGVEHLVLVGGDDVIPLARLEDRARVLSEEAYPEGGDLTADGSTVGRALAANQYLSDDPLAELDRVPLDSGSVAVAVGDDVCSAEPEYPLAWTPDLAVGRLVEMPAEIGRTISKFISTGGILVLSPRFCSSSGTQVCVDAGDCPAGETCDCPEGAICDRQLLVTGYDFLLDSAAEIAGSWRGRLSDAAVGDDLVDPAQAWGTSDLLAGLCGDGSAPYPVASLNGHANHYGEGVPGDLVHFDDGLETTALAAADACGAGNPLDLSGAVVYAVGCHGGLPVSDDAAPADHPLDLPQTFLGLGAVAYVANTGYGWGLKAGPPGYGERMVVLMTEQLAAGGTVEVGEAVKAAKTRYLAEDGGCFDAYDQKSVMQWTLFGLPMYSVQLPTASAAAAPGAPERPVPSLEQWPEEEQYGGVTVHRRESPDRAPPPPYLTRLLLHFDFSAQGVYRKFYSQRSCSVTTTRACDEDNPCPAGETCNPASANFELGDVAAACPDDSAGCYYALNGLAGGPADLPVQPYFVFDSRLSGTSQHGVLWTGGEYEQESGWRPLRPALQSNNDPDLHGDFSDLGALAPRRARASPRPTRVLPGADPDSSEGCPPSDLELNQLVVPTGEVVEDALGEPSIERRDLTVDLEILYFNDTTDPFANCDREGPDLGAGPYHLPPAGTVVSWAVPASDPSGVWRVLVVVDDQGQGAWVPIELADDDADGTWEGSYDAGGAGELSYFLQAVDRRGNVSWLLFEPQPGEEPDSGIPSGLPLAPAVEVPQADLSITKTDGVATALPGGTVTYAVEVANAGPSDATATVTDLFPPGLDCTWTCAAAGGASCTAGPVAGDLVDAVELPAGGTLTYDALCAIDLTATGTLINTATVTAPAGLDPEPANDAAIDLTELDARADLGVEKEAGQAAATPGAPMSYTITLTNHGPVTVTALTVVDTLPPALLDPVFTPSVGSYDPATGAWSGLALAAGYSVVLTLDATIDAAASGQLVNQVTVAAPAGVVDPIAGNDVAQDVTALGPIVTRVHSVASTGGGDLAAGEPTRATLTQLLAEFNEPVAGAGEVGSYLLVEAGDDGVLESEACALGRVGDDVEVAIEGALYDEPSRTAALAVGGGLPLPQGRYRLLVCAVIEDLLGNPLAGGDFARDFRVMVVHLLRNPTFDLDLADWLTVAEPPGEIVHDPLDADGAATSGSARVLGLSAQPYALSQCLPALPGSGVSFGGSALLDSPSPGGPLAFAQVEVFGRPDCGGEAIAGAAGGVVDAEPGALWQELPAAAAAMPAGAVSMLVSFVVDPAAALGFDAYFDDLYVYLHLFADGFEVGDTSRWSTAVE